MPTQIAVGVEHGVTSATDFSLGTLLRNKTEPGKEAFGANGTRILHEKRVVLRVHSTSCGQCKVTQSQRCKDFLELTLTYLHLKYGLAV
jgi:hypothetical protein